MILNVIQGASYHALQQAGSQLELGRAGWLLVIGFFALAIGTLLLAYVLGITLSNFRALPTLLLVADGLIGFLPALFQTDGQTGSPTAHGLIHNLAGLITFVLYVAAMVSCAVTFRRSPYWRTARVPAAAWAIAAVCSFVVLLLLGALNVFGLGERIALAVFLSWMLYLSWFVIRAGNGAPGRIPSAALGDGAS